MESVRDGLGLWMEEMGGHELGIDSGLKEKEVDFHDDRQERGRSRIIASPGYGLCVAERAAKRRRLAQTNEPFVNTNNADVTPNARALRARVCVRARTRSPCYRGGCPPPRFILGSHRPVQLTYAECLMSSIVNASQNLDFVNGQSSAAMERFIRGTPWESGTDAFQNDSLYSLAQRCSQAEEVEKGVHFISMINTIQFRMKIEE